MSGHAISDFASFAVLFFVGALAAALNALAGGGSLIAFPAQIALGASALHATPCAAKYCGCGRRIASR